MFQFLPVPSYFCQVIFLVIDLLLLGKIRTSAVYPDNLD